MVNAERAQLRADIRTHLQINGSRNWRVLRRRYSAVPQATWWRSIAREKARIGTQHLVFPMRHIPDTPATDYSNCNGQAGDESTSLPGLAGAAFDFLAVFRGLFADAKKLDEHAFHVDGRVRSPAILDRAIRLRLRLLKQGIALEREILSVGAQKAFYRALFEEIAKESPEVTRRLVDRLRAFNRSFDPRHEKSP